MTQKTEMGFWEHFDALRATLIRIAAMLTSLAVVLFIFMPDIFGAVILAPCRPDFPLYQLFDRLVGLDDSDFSVSLINIELASQMFIHLSASFSLALVIGFPFVIYQLWLFIRPALYEKERRNAATAFLFGNLMFYIGVAVGYLLVFPLTLRFLATYQLSPDIPNVISLDSYMSNFFTIVLIMGAVFELPLIGWLLGRIGIIRRRFFTRFRRHAIVALLIVAAIITPTGDPITLLIVFLPLYLLYEATSRLVPA